MAGRELLLPPLKSSVCVWVCACVCVCVRACIRPASHGLEEEKRPCLVPLVTRAEAAPQLSPADWRTVLVRQQFHPGAGGGGETTLRGVRQGADESGGIRRRTI